MVVVRPTRAQDQFLALLMSSHPRCGARSTPRVLSVVPQLELASPTAPTSGRSTTLTSTAGDNNLLPREGGVGVPVLPSPILLRIMWEDYFCFGAVGIRALLDVCNNGEVHDYCSVCFRVSPLLLGVTSAVPSVIHETRWTEKYVDCTRFIRIPVPLSPEWSPERKRYNMIDTVTGKEWDLHWCRDLIDERLWDASKRWWVAVEGNKLTVTDLNLRVTGDGRGSDTPAKGSVLVAVPVNSKRRVVLAAELDKFHPNWLLVKRRYGESSTLLEVVDVAQTHCSGKYTVLSTSIATFQYDRSFQFLMRKTKGGRSINVWIVHSFHPSPFSAYLYELEEGSCLLGCLPPLYFLEDFSSVSQISKSVFSEVGLEVLLNETVDITVDSIYCIFPSMNSTTVFGHPLIVEAKSHSSDQFRALLMSSHPRCGAQSPARVLFVIPQFADTSTSSTSTTTSTTPRPTTSSPSSNADSVGVPGSPFLLQVMWEFLNCGSGGAGFGVTIGVRNNEGVLLGRCVLRFGVSPLLLGATQPPPIIQQSVWGHRWIDATRFIRHCTVPPTSGSPPSRKKERYFMVDAGVTGKEWDVHWRDVVMSDRLWDANRRWWVSVQWSKMTVIDLLRVSAGDGDSGGGSGGGGVDCTAASRHSVVVGIPTSSGRSIVEQVEVSKMDPEWALIRSKCEGESTNTLFEVVDVAQTHRSGAYTVLSSTCCSFPFRGIEQFLMRRNNNKGGISSNVWIVKNTRNGPRTPPTLYEVEEGINGAPSVATSICNLDPRTTVCQITRSLFCIKPPTSLSITVVDCNDTTTPLRVVSLESESTRVFGGSGFLILSSGNEVKVMEAASNSVVLTVHSKSPGSSLEIESVAPFAQ
ncbi:hypothetical protein Pelo_686 [Pelomyxa schiedti]|nr:hypothetical protein Pelo_686 [Pelomyxa schiedti]